MRPSTLSLFLALAATVVASPKRPKHKTRSNATTTATASTATSSTSGGCNYLNVIGPNESTVYTGCSCPDADAGSEPQRAYIFNLTSVAPPCTHQLDTDLYPSVEVMPGDPGMALCEDWIPAGGANADGTVPLVPPYVGLCYTE